MFQTHFLHCVSSLTKIDHVSEIFKTIMYRALYSDIFPVCDTVSKIGVVKSPHLGLRIQTCSTVYTQYQQTFTDCSSLIHSVISLKEVYSPIHCRVLYEYTHREQEYSKCSVCIRSVLPVYSILQYSHTLFMSTDKYHRIQML